MNKLFHLKVNLILSNTILKNPRNASIKYMFFQELMKLFTILKSILVQSCTALVSLIFKHQEILLFNWCNIFYWYTSVLLEKTLHDQEIATVGTVRSNRLYNCKLSDDKYGYLVLIMWSCEQSSGLTTAVLPSFQRTNQLNQPKM